MTLKAMVKKWAKAYNVEEQLQGLLPSLEAHDQRDQYINLWVKDVKSANQAARQYRTSQARKRALVHTHFAMIEGTLYLLNKVVLDEYYRGAIQLTEREVEQLT